MKAFICRAVHGTVCTPYGCEKLQRKQEAGQPFLNILSIPSNLWCSMFGILVPMPAWLLRLQSCLCLAKQCSQQRGRPDERKHTCVSCRCNQCESPRGGHQHYLRGRDWRSVTHINKEVVVVVVVVAWMMMMTTIVIKAACFGLL